MEALVGLGKPSTVLKLPYLTIRGTFNHSLWRHWLDWENPPENGSTTRAPRSKKDLWTTRSHPQNVEVFQMKISTSVYLPGGATKYSSTVLEAFCKMSSLQFPSVTSSFLKNNSLNK